jgi:acyl transferase domain-containing protein/acyl carrier protein
MSGQALGTNQLSTSRRLLLALEEASAKLESAERSRTEPIAVIGMGCRFPGGADDPVAFWELLRQGRDGIVTVPPERWDIEAYYDPDPDAPGKMSTRYGGFLTGVDRFDPQFFGISPREAVLLDPQQRLLLEVTWEALESAGLPQEKVAGMPVGVFVGITASDYAQLITESGDERLFNAYYTSGNTLNAAAGRLSFVLGLQGPAMAVDTACSSSLVALHLACRSLRVGESRLAVAAGVNLMFFPGNTTALSKSHMMAPDGRCKTFDAAADGYVRGEGCGVVVLKRLSEAEANNDSILAVIRATSVNQDGHSSGFTVPNGTAQQALIREALASARLTPAAIDYIEAHGTGTSLGDPIEVNALAGVFGPDRSPDRPLIIGSVKTNIGHLESAAGIAGLIKVILALQHGEIPPHLHFKTPNSHIAWDKLAVRVPTEAMSWPVDGGRRRAGVSSFGAIGTNAHVVVEEAAPPKTGSPGIERSHQLLVLSAKTPEVLERLATRYAGFLESHPTASLADVCFSANTGRSHFGHRLCAVAADRQEMTVKLQQAAVRQEVTGVIRNEVLVGSRPPKKAFLFTGQGAQYVGMGRQLYASQPIFRQCLEECDRILADRLPGSLLAALFDDTGTSPLDQTIYTQPALFALEYALVQLWRSWGITPDIVIGHSVGEYVAACVAGVFNLEDGLRLIAERGRLMQELTKPGAMFAVRAAEARVMPFLASDRERVALAAVNGPESVVISGAREAVATAAARLAAEGIKSRPLEVSHAFHSPLMAPMLEAFRRAATAVRFVAPRLPIISNVTGRLAGKEMADVDYWLDHVLRPVRFADGMATLFAEGVPLIMEIGPKPVLLGMAAHCVGEGMMTPRWLPSLRPGEAEWRTLLESLGVLHASGVAVDWTGYDRGYERRRLQIPTYPWQRQRFWLDAASTARPRPSGAIPTVSSGHPLLGHQLDGALRDRLFYSSISQEAPSFLGDHRILRECVLPMTAYIEMALAAGRGLPGQGPLVLEALRIQEALVLPAATGTTLQLVWVPQGDDEATFEVFSRSDGHPDRPASWTHHAAGRLRRGRDVTPDDEASPLAGLREAINEPVAVDDFYRQFEDQGLVYGSSFQTLTELWRREGEALGCLADFDEVITDRSHYTLHPALLDVCLHVLKAAFTATLPEDVYLPVGIERLTVHGALGERIWSHARTTGRADAADLVLRGDLRIYRDDGQLVAEVNGMAVRKLTSIPQPLGIETDLAKWLYEIQWQPRPQPPAAAPPATGYWLVLCDEHGVGAALCDRIAEAGQRCRIVRPVSVSLPCNECGDRIDPLVVEDFRRLLAEALQPEPEGCLGIIHLWSLDHGQDAELSSEALRRAQVLGCGSVLHLVQALAVMPLTRWPRLWLVTRGSQALPGDAAATLAVAQAPLWGLARVIALEHPELRCVRVDLDPAADHTAVKGLWDELQAPMGPEDQIAFRQSRRYVARLARRPEGEAKGEAPSVVADGTYLITGGLGALGLQAARWLVEQGARHLLLVGRSAPSEQARRQVADWEKAEITVQVVRTDVSDSAAVHELIAAASMPPLRGVIHAAGILADGVLLQQRWEDFERVMAAKVAGAWHLHRATAAAPLDFFICYSSLASILGSPGQGNYAAANAFMDALAQQRRLAGEPGLSINWGPWAEAGMAAGLNRQIVSRRLARGVGTISPEAGRQLLVQLLGEKAAGQVAVLPIDWVRFHAELLDSASSPFIEAFSGAANKGAPTEPPFTEQLKGLPLQEARLRLAEHVCSQVATVLGLGSPATLQPRQRLFDLGVDSLMAVELRNRLEKSLGAPLRSTLLFDYPTLEALVDHLAEVVLSAHEPAGSTPAVAQGLDQSTLEQVMDLSESEAEARLLEELAKMEAQ